MKILHLSYGPGGVHEHLFHTIIEGFRAAGHDVTEAWLTGVVPIDYRSPASRVLAFRLAHESLTGLRRFLTARRIRKFLQAEQFDVVLTHRRKPAELIASAGRGLPISRRFAVWHDEREFDRWQVRWRAKYLFRDFVMIGVSDAVRADILASGAGFAPARVVAINNAIDVDTFEAALLERNAARNALKLAADAFVFGSIGRLVEKKGHADLIRAFAKVAPLHPQAHLVIIGAGPLLARLQQLVAELHLQAQVTLTGAIPRAFCYARALDTFVLPSYREGLPIALLEAACARLPCIASDLGGNRVVLADHGQIVKPGDTDGLTQAMLQVLALRPEQRQQQGEAIYRRLRTHFDRPVMMQAYADLLKA